MGAQGPALHPFELAVVGKRRGSAPQFAREWVRVLQRHPSAVGAPHMRDHDAALDRVGPDQASDVGGGAWLRVVVAAAAPPLVEGDAPSVAVRPRRAAPASEACEAETDVSRHVRTHAEQFTHAGLPPPPPPPAGRVYPSNLGAAKAGTKDDKSNPGYRDHREAEDLNHGHARRCWRSQTALWGPEEPIAASQYRSDRLGAKNGAGSSDRSRPRRICRAPARAESGTRGSLPAQPHGWRGPEGRCPGAPKRNPDRSRSGIRRLAHGGQSRSTLQRSGPGS